MEESELQAAAEGLRETWERGDLAGAVHDAIGALEAAAEAAAVLERIVTAWPEWDEPRAECSRCGGWVIDLTGGQTLGEVLAASVAHSGEECPPRG